MKNLLKLSLIIGLVFMFMSSLVEAGTSLIKIYNGFKGKPINAHLAGRLHPVTGVRYSRAGFPIFRSSFDCNMGYSQSEYLSMKNQSSKSSLRNKHFNVCSDQLWNNIKNDRSARNKYSAIQQADLRNGRTPRGFTWHHSERDKNLLELVDRRIHDRTAHTGGMSVWW